MSDLFTLSRYKSRWDITVGRDGFNIYSALRKPTATSVVYLVARSSGELAALIDRFEAAGC